MLTSAVAVVATGTDVTTSNVDTGGVLMNPNFSVRYILYL